MGLSDILFGKPKYVKRTVSYGKTIFRVDVADSFRKISRGLMGRESVPKYGGMLFVFGKPGRYGFWMLNMRFSIDIIWLDQSGRAVHVWKNAETCRSIFSCRTVAPREYAKYVIEINAGMASRLGIRKGSRFRI